MGSPRCLFEKIPLKLVKFLWIFQGAGAVKKIFIIIYSGIFILAGHLTLSAQTLEEAALARIHARLSEEEEYSEFSGVVLLAHKGEIIFNEGFGYADVEKEEELTGESRFMIASVSKSFTAACIMKLEQEGKLSVYDNIGKYLPEYPGWAGEVITIHQLLTHTSGIPDYINDYPITFRIKRALNWHPTIERLIGSFKNKELNFDPGSDYDYSNSGYVLLARIVENVSGIEFNQYLERNIFKPLHMDHTGTGSFDALNDRVVAYGGRSEDPRPLKNFRTEYIYGMGGIYSNAVDLHKWVSSFTDSVILKANQRERIFTPFKKGYGYGWEISEDDGRLIYSHGGYFPGWNSWVQFYPDDSLEIIILSNRDRSMPYWLVHDIADSWFANMGNEGDQSELEDRGEVVPMCGRYIKTGMGDEVNRYGLSEIMVATEEEGVLKLKSSNGNAWELEKVSNDLWKESTNLFTVKFEEYDGVSMLTVTDGNRVWYWNRVGK
jgi:CubicO group peptidase (beta-lactamase class C family)